MEDTLRWSVVAAIAPVLWGTAYAVTQHWLPPENPLYGAAIRALPAGLVLLALRRRRPRGSWWWRAAVLGTLTMGAFFALVYVAAQRLPTSVASTVMATSPIVMMALAWAWLHARPRLAALVGAVLGVAGVATMLMAGGTEVDPLGVLASVAAMTLSSVGFVLAKRWGTGVDVVALTSWQLVAGGGVLLLLAVAVEGAPPVLDASALLGFGYVSLAATALAYVAWFAALQRLDAGSVGLVGLLNPVTGVLLGILVAHEALTARQLLGIAVVVAGLLLGQPALTGRLSRLRASRSARPGPGCPVSGPQAPTPAPCGCTG
ncbi:MAG: EamA family transporter [Cellulomonadaceae bacterium]